MTTLLEALESLYAEVPAMECKGLCWNSCGPIDMSPYEHERLLDQGYAIPAFTSERAERWANNEPLHCPALDRTTLKCSAYEVRPMICRIWGSTESMLCDHGCSPSRIMSDAEALDLTIRSLSLSDSKMPAGAREEMQSLLADPVVGPLMRRLLNGDRSVIPELGARITEWRIHD